MNTTEEYVRAEMRTVDRLWRAGAISYDSAKSCVAPWLRALALADQPTQQLPPGPPAFPSFEVERKDTDGADG